MDISESRFDFHPFECFSLQHRSCISIGSNVSPVSQGLFFLLVQVSFNFSYSPFLPLHIPFDRHFFLALSSVFAFMLPSAHSSSSSSTLPLVPQLNYSSSTRTRPTSAEPQSLHHAHRRLQWSRRRVLQQQQWRQRGRPAGVGAHFPAPASGAVSGQPVWTPVQPTERPGQHHGD